MVGTKRLRYWEDIVKFPDTFRPRLCRLSSVNFEARTMETEVDLPNKDLSIDPRDVREYPAATGAR
jgi:hypothetical protein